MYPEYIILTSCSQNGQGKYTEICIWGVVGQRDSAVGRVLALHVADLVLILSSPYDSPRLPGVVPKGRVRHNP